MTTNNNEARLVEQILNLSSYSLWLLESEFEPLTPVSKYQTILFTASAVINRLKAINFFNSNDFNSSVFLDKLMTASLEKFNEYKAIHSTSYNTFKHRSTIIEGNLNRENRLVFAKNLITIKKNSEYLLRVFELEINQKQGFKILYTNLYLFPFFETNIDLEEQNRLRNSYLQIINTHDLMGMENFNRKVSILINDLAERLPI